MRADFLRLARTFGTEIAQICGRYARDFACKILKFSKIAATDARSQCKRDINSLLTHAAQDAQLFLSAGMPTVLLTTKFCFQKPGQPKDEGVLGAVYLQRKFKNVVKISSFL